MKISFLNQHQLIKKSNQANANKAPFNQEEVANPKIVVGRVKEFGPITVTLLAIEAAIGALTFGVSRGANPKRLPKMKEGVQCYQMHPQAEHTHTIKMSDFPYKKKIKLADGFNRVINIFGGCHTYVEAREHFYKIINSEARQCERDYYRLVLRDSIKEAWVEILSEQDLEKALELLNNGEKQMQASDFTYDKIPSREHVGLKAILSQKLGNESEYRGECSLMEYTSFLHTITEKEELEAKKVFLQLAVEENGMVGEAFSSLDLLYLLSKKCLLEVDKPHFFSIEPEDIQKDCLTNVKGGKYAIALICSLLRNFKLLKKNHHLLPNEGNISKGHINEIFSFVAKESLTKFPIFDSQKDICEYIENAITIYICSHFFQKEYTQVEVQELIENLIFLKDSDFESSWETSGKEEFKDKSVFIVDTSSQSQEAFFSFIDSIKESLKDQKVNYISCPMKRIYHLPTGYLGKGEASGLLKSQIVDQIIKNKESKFLLICHQKGIEVIEKAVLGLSEEAQKQIQVATFSPVSFSKRLKNCTYYQSPYDTLSKFVLNISNNSFLKLVTLDEYIFDRLSKKIPSELNHPTYFKKIIELIHNFNVGK